MSHILSEEVEEVVYRKQSRLTAVMCDKCDKKILALNGDHDDNRYFRVTTGHHDWGNDSCESIEHFDICPTCIDTFVTEYLANASGTDYIDIETEYVYPKLEYCD